METHNAQGLSYLQKELELKQNLVGEGFLRPSADKRIRVNIIGEITKAERFDVDQLYLNYELDKPDNWQFDNDDDDYSGEPAEVLLELNRTSSTTNIARPNILYVEGEAIPVFNYSFPVDWQFLADPDLMNKKWPKIIIQVNSLDSWGRYRVEGYAFAEVPRYSGVHHIEVQAWKPHQNYEAKAFSYFLGGSIRVKDVKEITKTSYKLDNDQEGILNRFEMTSESAGSIHLTLNVVKQAEALMQETRKAFRDTKHKEKLEELKTKNDEETLARTGITGPALMRTDFGLISRFSNA